LIFFQNSFIKSIVRNYKKHIEIFFFPKRLRRRLGPQIHNLHESLPTARVDCYPEAACNHISCQRLIASYAGFYEQYCRTPLDDAKSSFNKLTLHAIDLREYSGAKTYLKQISRRNSFFMRDIKKAQKNGFWVSPFTHSQKVHEMAEIRRSVSMRSFGPVLQWPLLKKYPNNNELASFTGHSSDAIACSLHWELLFGVFEGPKLNIEQSRLVGFARLHRIGNIASYDELIGHGQYLDRGIVKLLHWQIVQWLVDSSESCTQGVKYLAHGSVERGNEGFFFWKKKALFWPYLVDLVNFQLPVDFDEDQYLALNPDVRGSHISPRIHYKIHGRLEGRAYK